MADNNKPEKTNRIKGADLNREKQMFSFISYSKGNEIKLNFITFSPSAHSDRMYSNALSISLLIDKKPFIVNPDVEWVHKKSLWKNYFDGTLSQNTIRINLKNQIEFSKDQNPIKHNKIRILESFNENQYLKIKASHNRYRKLGIIHQREINFDKIKNLILINDTIECEKKGFYFVEMPFHFHPKISVKQNNPINFQANDESGHLIYLAIDRKFKTKMVKGQVIPQLLGWYPTGNNKQEPCFTLYCSVLIEQTTSFQSVILIK